MPSILEQPSAGRDESDEDAGPVTRIDNQVDDKPRQRGLSVMFGGSNAIATNSKSSEPPSTDTTSAPAPASGQAPIAAGGNNLPKGGSFVDTGIDGGLTYTNTGTSPPASPTVSVGSAGQSSSFGNAALQRSLDAAQSRVADLGEENKRLEEQMQEVKRGAEAYAKSLEETMHEEIQKERTRSEDAQKAMQSSQEASHAAVLSELNAKHASTVEALRRQIGQLQAEVSEGKRAIEEMKANEQSFREAFVAEMQKEFEDESDSDEGSGGDSDGKDRGGAAASIPLQLLDEILRGDDMDGTSATEGTVAGMGDINLDDLDVDTLLMEDERLLAQQTHVAQQQAHQPRTQAPQTQASNYADVPEGTVLGHRSSDAEDYAMLAGAMNTIAENDQVDAPAQVDNDVPASFLDTQRQQQHQEKDEQQQQQQQQRQGAETESFITQSGEGADDATASPWIMVNDEQYGAYFWNQETQDSTYDFPKEGYYTPEGAYVTPEQSMAFAAEQAAANEAAQAAANAGQSNGTGAGEENKIQQQPEQNTSNSEPSLQNQNFEQPPPQNPQQSSQPPSAVPSPRNSAAGPAGSFNAPDSDAPPMMMPVSTKEDQRPTTASKPSQLRERQSETVVEALQGVVVALEAVGVAKKQKRQMSEIQKGISALARILSADDSSMTEVFKTNLEGIRKAADSSRYSEANACLKKITSDKDGWRNHKAWLRPLQNLLRLAGKNLQEGESTGAKKSGAPAGFMNPGSSNVSLR